MSSNSSGSDPMEEAADDLDSETIHIAADDLDAENIHIAADDLDSDTVHIESPENSVPESDTEDHSEISPEGTQNNGNPEYESITYPASPSSPGKYESESEGMDDPPHSSSPESYFMADTAQAIHSEENGCPGLGIGVEELLLVKIEEVDENLSSTDCENGGNDNEILGNFEEPRNLSQKDSIWDEYEEVDGNPPEWRCRKCKTPVSPRTHRLKAHHDKCVKLKKRGRPKGSCKKSVPAPRQRRTERHCPAAAVLNTRRRRGSHRSSEKQCLLCGIEIFNLNSSYSRNPNSVYRLWAESCANSICELLKLDQSFYPFFLTADYCQTCQEVCNDIDFTLKSLNILQERLNHTRQTVEDLLKGNYEAISAEVKNFSFSFVSNINSYDHIVKTIYDALFLTVEQPPVIIKVRGNEPTRKRNHRQRLPLLKTLSVEVRGKRTRPKVSMADLLDEDDELELNNEVQNEPPVDEWLPADNSNDDEDWEAPIAKNKPKNKSKVGRRPIRRERRHGDDIQKHKCTFDKCSFSSSKLFSLDVHVRQKHEGSKTPYRCKHCEKQFKTYEILTYHMKRHSAAKLPCPVKNCTRKFYEKSTLRKHVAWKHYLHDRHICIYCTKTFDQKEEEVWKLHTALHESETIPFSCVLPGCNFTPTNSMDLKKHVAHEHEEKTITCELCPGKLFSSYNSLKSHKQKEHAIPEGDGFKCSVPDCGYTSNRKGDLIRHNGTHVTERSFQCETCGSSYKNKGSLTRHIMTHTGECKYKCKICSKSFNMGHKLKNHEEIHALTKSYLCPKCGKAFRALKNLQQHSTYHCFSDSAERPKVVKRNRRVNKASSSISDLAVSTLPGDRHRSGPEEKDTDATTSSTLALNPSQLACIATYTDTMNNERVSIPIMRGTQNSTCEINLPHHGRSWAPQPAQAQQQYHHPNAFMGQSFSTLDLSQASNFMPSTSTASQFGMIPNQTHWNFVP